MGRAMDDLIRMSQEQFEQDRLRWRWAVVDLDSVRHVTESAKFANLVGPRTALDESFVTAISSLASANHSALLDQTISANAAALAVLRDPGPHVMAVEQLHAISRGWERELDSFRELSNVRNAAMEAVFGSHLTRLTEISLLAQSALAHLPAHDFGRALGVPDGMRSVLNERFTKFGDSYTRLFESFDQPRTSILTLPPALSELPSVEFFNAVDLLRVTSPADGPEDEFEDDRQAVREEIAEEAGDGLRTLLSAFDAELLPLWDGACHALRSSNPDRARHFAISLRELMTHVMHRLSPDEELRAWSTSANDFWNGRPTRKARLRFIARVVNHGPFTDFVEKDIEATLAAFNLFHAGAHAVNSGLTDAQLAALHSRVQSAIYFMLSTAREGDEKGYLGHG